MPAGECPMSFSAMPAFGFEFSHRENCPCAHCQHAPHAIGNGTTTRSPARRFRTSGPTSTTSPMNSWPTMSPFFMVGTKPSYMCRSEPQIAVDVMRTMASRRLRICGSGTSATSTSPRPIQRFARTSLTPADGQRLRLVLACLVHRARALRAALRAQDLAGLRDLLEPPEVVLDLLPWLLAEQPGQRLGEPAARQLVVELDADLRATVARRRREPHGAAV